MVRRGFVCAAAVGALLLSAPWSVQAQDRSGFFLGVGGGYGTTGVSSPELGPDTNREGSGAGYLRAGWALDPQLIVGGELNVWVKTATLDELEPTFDFQLNIYQVSGTLTYYPQPRGGFFVKGGAGAAFMDADMKFLGSSMKLDLGRGLGLLAGAGYDIPVGRRIAVTPAVNFWYGRLGDLDFAGERLFSDWSHNVVDFTVGITFP